MGLTVSAIIINSLPTFTGGEEPAKGKKINFSKTKLNGLSPQNLSINFVDGCTLIFLEMISVGNIDDNAALTGLENDLNNIFPNATFLVIEINDTADIKAFSLVENGIKVRTKAVVQGELFLDYGDLISEEIELYDMIIKVLNETYPATLKETDDRFAALGEIARKKYYLRLRDKLFEKTRRDNSFHYTDGSLDEHLIEIEMGKIIKYDFFDIEQMEFIEFEKKKFNFKKESLRQFLFLAKNEIMGL